MNATDEPARRGDATAVDPEPEDVRRIAPGAAVVQVEAGYATLVEARRSGARGGARIEGAVALAVDGTEPAHREPVVDGIPERSVLILYCPSSDAGVVVRAARALIRQGRDPARVAILDGDPEAWSDVGFPILRN